ncbi:MAG: hypothetical protein LWW95_10080 [Candidatus Desulfofervidus auxilii]|nr:hypothetical protein [Candidatus Desulfofervidus auxilii]
MQIIETIKGYDITAGYDEPLGHVFLVIEKNEDLIYSNLNLDNPFEIKDFSYFVDVAKYYDLDISHMKEQIHNARDTNTNDDE